MASQNHITASEDSTKKEWSKPEIFVISENNIQTHSNTDTKESAFAHPSS